MPGKTLAEQLTAATKQNEEFKATIEGFTTSASENAEKVSGLEAGLTAAQAELVTAKAELVTAQEELAAAKGELVTAQEGLATASADLEQVKGQLALVPGQADLSKGTDPVADGSSGGDGSGSGLYAQYEEMKKTDAEAATMFYRENEAAIKAENAASIADPTKK